MTIKVKATITGVVEEERYETLEFALRAYESMSKDPRARWRRDQLTEAVNAKSNTPLSELVGKDVVLELSNETYNKHIYVRVHNILPLSALGEGRQTLLP